MLHDECDLSFSWWVAATFLHQQQFPPPPSHPTPTRNPAVKTRRHRIMNVRDAREGVSQRFSASKAAASMEGVSLVGTAQASTTKGSTCPGAAPAPVAVPRLAYTIRSGSRSELLLLLRRGRPVNPSSSSPLLSPSVVPPITTGATTEAAALREECLRRRVFLTLLAGLRGALEATRWRGRPLAALATAAELQELPARWVMQSIDSLPDAPPPQDQSNSDEKDHSNGAYDNANLTRSEELGGYALLTRDGVTPLDVGCGVGLCVPEGGGSSSSSSSSMAGPQPPDGDEAQRFTIVATAPMSAGQYWVDIAPIGAGSAVDTLASATAGVNPAAMGVTESAAAVSRVDREAVRLRPALPTHFDALLPCDDLQGPRGTSTCLYLMALLAAKGTGIGRGRNTAATTTISGGGGGRPEVAAADFANAMAEAARAARLALFNELATVGGPPGLSQQGTRTATSSPPPPLSPQFTASIVRDMVVFTVRDGDDERESPPPLQALGRTVAKLARMWDARVAAEDAAAVAPASAVAPQIESLLAASDGSSGGGGGLVPSSSAPLDIMTTMTTTAAAPLASFLTAVCTVLMRYGLLLGDKGYNQGPQAAIPPSVMAALHGAFDVTAEAFASPLNAQLPLYGSLFPDTDAPFGSLGSFFDVDFTAGHVEVNPPFDAVVIERMRRRLLAALAAADERSESLLFVLVLPSHDLDDGETTTTASGAKRPRPGPTTATTTTVTTTTTTTTTDRTLRESRFCLAHALCAADDAAYVDGHQHLLRAPFFCIATPTRLTVVGNEAARRRYPDAQRRLEAVRDAWRRLTREELQ